MKRDFVDTWFYRYIGSAFKNPKKFLFCCKYPFWKMRNYQGKFIGYDYTYYDLIDLGWQKAFGKELTNDIAKALKADRIPKHKWHNVVYWEDIKEKFGSLCLYCISTDKVLDVLDKYERMSKDYCICCGAPATHVTKGYVIYLCKDCAEAYINKYTNNKIEEK